MKPNFSASASDASPVGDAQRKPLEDRAKKREPRSRLWLLVWLAFALQITAWVLWLKIATQHRVEDVPLATVPTHPPHEAQNDARADGENVNHDVSPTSDTQNKPVEQPRP